MDNNILDIGYRAPEKKKILVVDDEPALLSLVFDTFAEDFKIVGAHNGHEGLEKAESEHPDVILLDVMMPDLNGFEVLKHLRGNPVTKDIPVIIMTAKGFDATMVDMLKREPGVVGFLSKPFHMANIRHTIRLALEKKA